MADEQEQVGTDPRIEAEVDVQQDGGPEDEHPEGAVEPVALVELGEVVDLQEHPLERHDDDGGEDGLGDNSLRTSALRGRGFGSKSRQ